jgi:bifunctional non-homologous end joining protein LigD
MSLKEYNRKRDFKKTREPAAARSGATGNRFVIQKHAASRLHYDFRLEMEGVLKSWAVPKGIPFIKGEKHLAVQVEDHPVSYIDFEGTIPAGNYGGGTVMVWDQGTFATLEKLPAQELKHGRLHFTLAGKKLHGAWHLVRMHGGEQWLLIKGEEDAKPVSTKMDDTSALSGKSMAQLSRGGAVWESNRPQPEKITRRVAAKPVANKSPIPNSKPVFIEPMKARLIESPPENNDWIYEIKFDGYRALAEKTKDGVHLLSRNEKDFSGRFPEIAAAIASLNAQEAMIDGEIVALDKKGVSSFQLLQNSDMDVIRPPIFFYAFDLLRLNGRDLRSQPLLERRRQLEKILGGETGLIRYSASLGEAAGKLLVKARKHGLEGLIGKRKDSPYEAGRRSGAWIKLKLHQEQEFVIGGFSEPEGSRLHFGALLIGFYDRQGLQFCGRVGTGFAARLLHNLNERFQKIRQADCPFANLPETRRSRYSTQITATELKHCHWVKPLLVCQVRFSEWTRDGKLRQPVFLGLREDKDAGEVIREKAA